MRAFHGVAASAGSARYRAVIKRSLKYQMLVRCLAVPGFGAAAGATIPWLAVRQGRAGARGKNRSYLKSAWVAFEELYREANGKKGKKR